MDRDGALNAQSEILERVMGFSQIPGAQSSVFPDAPVFAPDPDLYSGPGPIRAFSSNERDAEDFDPRRMIGIGLHPPQNEDDQDGYKVAIRCQREIDLNGPIVRAALEQAKGEARVTYTGLVIAHGSPPTSSSAVQRPRLQIGQSIGHVQVTSGTIGGFVELADEPGLYILSNNHVLANANNAHVNDTILQPGRADGGVDPTHRVAGLSRWEPISFNPSIANEIDAAIALIDEDVIAREAIVSGLPGLPALVISGRTSIVLGQDAVQKVGRSTGGTSGRVVTINESVSPNFNVNGYQQQAWFNGQLSMEGDSGHFSQPGDSGAMIINSAMDMVALLFAGTSTGGSNGGGITYANPIDRVISRMGIRV